MRARTYPAEVDPRQAVGVEKEAIVDLEETAEGRQDGLQRPAKKKKKRKKKNMQGARTCEWG